jgi:predicted small secreted protein
MARKVLTVLMMLGILGSMSALSGCNTVAGAGKDIERGGEKVQGAAKDAQQKMTRARGRRRSLEPASASVDGRPARPCYDN